MDSNCNKKWKRRNNLLDACSKSGFRSFKKSEDYEIHQLGCSGNQIKDERFEVCEMKKRNI